MNQTTNEITDQGGPELPTGSVMVPEPPGIGVFGNTSITGVSKLPKKSGSTSRTNWTKELNKIVMRCYLKSNPKVRGYRKRMHKIWDEMGLFELSEQKLVGQTRVIKTNGWISELELEELNREIESENNCQSHTVTNVESDVDGRTVTQIEGMNNEIGGQIELGDNRLNEDIGNFDCLEVEDSGNWSEAVAKENMKADGLGDDDIKVFEMMVNELNGNIGRPMNLRFVDRKKLRDFTSNVNKIIPYLEMKNLSQCNNILLAAGNVVRKMLGIKEKLKYRGKTEPWWKRRLNGQIIELRQGISRLEALQSKTLKSEATKERLWNKYKIKQKGLRTVVEELKQRVTAKSAKIKRYEGRINQYQQNRMYSNNQKMFFERLEGKERSNDMIPDAIETKTFWKEIWEKEIEHNHRAEWIESVEKEVYDKTYQQRNYSISIESFRRQLSKTSNWKSPGPDGVQGYWIKNITSLHCPLVTMLNCSLASGYVPEWLTKGTTVLIMKDTKKGTHVANYRPITCLSMLWKVFTGVLYQEIYDHLEANHLLPVEQKGCRKRSRGTKDQLLIDKMIIKNCKRRHTGLAMGWIDYKKAFDMVPHSWILKCLDMFKVADNIKVLLTNSMTNWKTELTAGGVSLGEVKVKRGIFQGDSLSPLLFVISLIPMSFILRRVKAGYELGKEEISVNHLLYMDDLKLFGRNEKELDMLVNTVRVFSNDICMQFGVSKCGVLVMKRGKMSKCKGIEIPSGELIKEIDTEGGYKYLGVLEADAIKDKKIKDNLKREYIRRVRNILKSKLNSKNVVNAINCRAISIIRYSAGIIKWNLSEVKELDRKTRKLLTIHNMFHKRGDIDRLYVKRSEGGRGMISVEDCVLIEKNSLHKYTIESDEPMLKAVVKEEVIEQGKTKQEINQVRIDNFDSKDMHSVFFKKTEFRDKQTWDWLKIGNLKKATEGMLMAAQEQALRTKSIQYHIDKTEANPLCRLCGEREETVAHIVSECKQLAQRQYKEWRHDVIAKVIHWEMCKVNDLPYAEKWYEHKPESVTENERVKILWDFKIQTDKELKHNKPDIVILDKQKRTCMIIDVACPFDIRIQEKEKEKIERYNDLKWELMRIWNCSKVKVIPIIIGALGTVSKSFKGWLSTISSNITFGILQKACLLGTARTLRIVLNI